MTDKPEGAVSYKDGVERKVPVVLGEREHNEAQMNESKRVHELVARVKQYIAADRMDVWEELKNRQEAQMRQVQQNPESVTAETGILPDAVAEIAAELFAMWDESDERDVVGLELHRGVLFHHPHSWFQVEADAELIVDLKHIHLIDPAPRGLELPEPFLVVPPLSQFHLCYAGRCDQVAE